MSMAKSVDPSLWWDPFTTLLTELDNATASSCSFSIPPHLAKKLKDNHPWLVDTVSLFKPPNPKSREALSSPAVKIGPHELSIKPELKDKALRVSSYLNLDEVQCYIIVERSLEQNGLSLNSIVEEYLHVVLLYYYMERQCLLKCTRLILMQAVSVGLEFNEEDAFRDKALKLISDGLERKLVLLFQDLLSSSHPEQMDLDLFSLWAEETLVEDNLVLDILFLIYYESLCTCNGEMWKKLFSFYQGILSGSYNFTKLAISSEALKSSYHAKIQLLLILIQTLNLENLLQLVHDEIPFREACFSFSLIDIQQMDALVSSFASFEMKEVGPLILSWAVFLSLISSLPGREESNILMEIDHVGYIHQAFEAASLCNFVEILESDLFKESDAPVAGYRSVLRNCISAFIASYEINSQVQDGALNLILDIICKIYRGEESLCTQFWDRESIIDGPIRCLLYSLEGEFPFRIAEFVRLLSSLCQGSWPAECVYKFLDKSVGITSSFEVTSESLVDGNFQIVETHMSLQVPGVEGLVIPSKTRGHLLKIIDSNTVLVRWEYTQSAVLVLLLRLAQQLYFKSDEEVFFTLDLLSQLVSFNMAVTFSLMDVGKSFYFQAAGTDADADTEKNMWLVEIICTVIKKLSTNSSGAAVMSICINILVKMLKCVPSQVAAVALKANIFEMAWTANMFSVGYNGSSSGSWLLSGKLAKMLLIDCEQNDYDSPLTVAVLDFTSQLLETRIENDLVLALVVFFLQYILVNHEYWKYKVKHVRWKVTLKVLEVMKTCLTAVSLSDKVGVTVHDMLLHDSSIHDVLFRLVATKQTLENLYVSRLFELMEMEGFELAVGSALDILYNMLSKFSLEISPGLPVFHQAVLSSTTKPVPVAVAVTSLISYFHSPAIQVNSARVLSMLLITADSLQPSGAVCLGLDDKQIAELRSSLRSILLERGEWNEDLLVAIIKMLTSAARYQPPFFVSIFAPKEDTNVQLNNDGDHKESTIGASSVSSSCRKSTLVDALMQLVEECNNFFNSNPRILLSVLDLLNALWQAAVQYIDILDRLKSTGSCWKQLSNCISLVASWKASSTETLSEMEAQNLTYKYQCQSTILEIIAYDMFLMKKLSLAESLLKEASKLKESQENATSTDEAKFPDGCAFKDILSSWSERSILGNLIKSYSSCEYKNEECHRMKVATSLLIVHVMGKLEAGNSGSLSVALLEKIHATYRKLISLPAFSELLAQYSNRSYGEGKQLKSLILNDLYYHLQGELEGREMDPGPFRELSGYLVESKCFAGYQLKHEEEHFTNDKDVYLFDLIRIQLELGLDVWDYTEWKESKAIAETMLGCMQEVNTMILIASSKLSALKALITMLTMYEDELPGKKATTTQGKIPDQLCFSCIDHICESFHDTVESLSQVLDGSEWIVDFLTAQAELLLHLLRSVQSSLPLSVCVLVLKISASGLKTLNGLRSFVTGVHNTVKLLLMLLLSALEFGKFSDKESKDFTEVSNVCLGLLPILCNCTNSVENFALSLGTIDLILRDLLIPGTWFPIIKNHLPLQHVILKLCDKNDLESVPVTFKFLLTLALVRGGAEMLLSAGFFSSLKAFFADWLEGSPSTVIIDNNGNGKSSEKSEKPQNIWGLGLAVVTAILQSLGDHASTDIMDNLITYFFSEKAYLISYHLNAPDFPSDKHDKKRPRAQRTQTSLTALKETEHTLMLMSTLAKDWSTWVKAMRGMNSQLREKSIHLLAFISRGVHRVGESPSRTAPLLCPPILKEEFEYCNKSSLVNSRNGWFALTPFCCVSKTKLSAVSGALVIKGRSTEIPVSATCFSDLVAMQIYRIAFLLLKFLCSEAEGAVKRSEEVGFIDLARIPELPMPEILHGLQDQAIAVVCELCDANKSKQMPSEIKAVCVLLLQILDMSLYLELCVLQICGIRPVLGRVDDLLKGAKLLLKAMEGHAFSKPSAKSLKQIISLVYPGSLPNEGFM